MERRVDRFWRKLEDGRIQCDVCPRHCRMRAGQRGLCFVRAAAEDGVRVSMDGRGRCMDNIFIERLWRSLKQEAVYLTELTDGFHARRVIKEWIGFYNTRRPHSALEHRTPAEAYWVGRTEMQAA